MALPIKAVVEPAIAASTLLQSESANVPSHVSVLLNMIGTTALTCPMMSSALPLQLVSLSPGCKMFSPMAAWFFPAVDVVVAECVDAGTVRQPHAVSTARAEDKWERQKKSFSLPLETPIGTGLSNLVFGSGSPPPSPPGLCLGLWSRATIGPVTLTATGTLSTLGGIPPTPGSRGEHYHTRVAARRQPDAHGHNSIDPYQ